MKQSILVTGSSGLIGSEVVTHFQECGWDRKKSGKGVVWARVPTAAIVDGQRLALHRTRQPMEERVRRELPQSIP